VNVKKLTAYLEKVDAVAAAVCIHFFLWRQPAISRMVAIGNKNRELSKKKEIILRLDRAKKNGDDDECPKCRNKMKRKRGDCQLPPSLNWGQSVNVRGWEWELENEWSTAVLRG
jgi:hypothetical protein